MNVFIIRHGETLNQGGNIVLSAKGREQAYMDGKWLKNYFQKYNESPSNIEMLYSPLIRTTQTKNLINSTLIVKKSRAVKQLREQEYGMFEGLDFNKQKEIYPELYKEYMQTKIERGRFFARFPEGESPEDVCNRIKDLVEEVKKISETKNVIIISHATTIKCFLLVWFNYSPYMWYKNEPIPSNCSIRLINNSHDYGYIYEP